MRRIFLAVLVFVVGCDDVAKSPSSYVKTWGDPVTGIVNADDKWTCPKGYALLFFQGSGLNPSCFAYVPAQPIAIAPINRKD